MYQTDYEIGQNETVMVEKGFMHKLRHAEINVEEYQFISQI